MKFTDYTLIIGLFFFALFITMVLMPAPFTSNGLTVIHLILIGSMAFGFSFVTVVIVICERFDKK